MKIQMRGKGGDELILGRKRKPPGTRAVHGFIGEAMIDDAIDAR
jgi:hypothetical protein